MASDGLIELEISTPTGLKVKTSVSGVSAPSVQGEFGVLPGHRPLLAALAPGVVRYEASGKTHVAAVGSGFADARSTTVSILADAFADGAEVDVDVVRGELKVAAEELKAHDDGDGTGNFAQDSAKRHQLATKVAWFAAQLDAAKASGASVN